MFIFFYNAVNIVCVLTDCARLRESGRGHRGNSRKFSSRFACIDDAG